MTLASLIDVLTEMLEEFPEYADLPVRAYAGSNVGMSNVEGVSFERRNGELYVDLFLY